ncbi:hypothetical protein SZMC14600_03436 [Saccharomonospora azurea SZMC 14600]|uniref:hypothetical protein n=1 Tax=Saccharomonospora azurea TaxID=40988 RepID=UPI00023FFE43|nr:hypothetical protein [Saccharomonospora azurea]EHK88727.1 hypothetical protein SZMC14600_03436 [Saccharomonospora azurea SZMC 14600]
MTTSYTGDGQVHVRDNSGVIFQMGLMGELPRDVHRLLRTSLDERPSATTLLSDVDRVFVQPRNFDLLLDRLATAGVLLLTGVPGSGRRTTALKLLSKSGDPEHTCWELDTDREHDDEKVSLDVPEDVEGDGLLLDLTSHGLGDCERWLDAVHQARAQLRDRRCTLVVLVTSTFANQPGRWWSTLVKQLHPPTPRAVLAAHLRAIGIAAGDAELDDVLGPVADRGLGTLAHLATLIADEREAQPEAGLRSWAARAHTVLDDRPATLTPWLNEHRDAPARALMLSAAMLEGCSAETVWTASETLLRQVRFTAPQSPVLERRGVSERLGELGFDVERDGAVRLRRDKGFHHRHVRAHFFADHPDLREPLTQWVVQVGQNRALTVADRTVLALRFTEQCLGIGRPELVSEVIGEWLRGSDFPPLAGCAHGMLRSGLLHDRHGAHFRWQIWNWARQPPPDAPSAFLTMLGDVCQDVIAPRYPSQAIVRLHHLARHRRPEVSEHAVTLLSRSVQDRRFLRRLVQRFWDVFEKRVRENDVVLFGRLLTPETFDGGEQPGRLLAERGVRGHLTRSWKVVLEQPRQWWQGGVFAWLHGALDPHRREVVVDILAAACAGDLTLSSQLEQTATHWFDAVTGDDTRDAAHVLDLLRARLDSALGLHFLSTQKGFPS